MRFEFYLKHIYKFMRILKYYKYYHDKNKKITSIVS